MEDYLRDIAVIRRAVDRATPFEGYSAIGIAISGLLSVVGWGLLEYRLRAAPEPKPEAVLSMWWWVLAASLLANGWGIYSNLRARGLTWGESRLGALLRALLPGLLAGGVVSAMLWQRGYFEMLPPVWMVCYGLALSGLRGLGPAGVERVGYGYLICGAMGGIWLPPAALLRPEFMGGVFGAGQLMAACVVWHHDVRRVRHAANQNGDPR